MVRRIGLFLVLLLLLFVFSGCGFFRKKKEPPKKPPETIELLYYKMNDSAATMKPLFEAYQAKHPNIRIRYVEFDDIETYEDRIVNELAEGAGPDLFSMKNHWLLKHRKKLAPMPETEGTVEQFRQIFVDVAAKDLIARDEQGVERVYALPMTVDTLAVYYNKDHFNDAIPEKGGPAGTWEEFKKDTEKLTKRDQSFERFERSGAALGRADNISYAADILYLLMRQYRAKFYNEDGTQAIFAHQQETDEKGKPQVPGVDALALYTSFALPSNPHFSWNQYLADPESSEKELRSFVTGKTSMIFGYSTTYQDILDAIQKVKTEGKVETIEPSVIGIAPVPQVKDPALTAEKRITYSTYFAETVSRTSLHQKEAWNLLLFLTSPEALTIYHTATKKPTSRRDMLEGQRKEPLFGVFADQIGFAESAVIYQEKTYEKIFRAAIQAVLETKTPLQALSEAEKAITKLLPKNGLFPKMSVPPKPKS